MTTTDTSISNLIINKLTKQQYEGIATPSDTELYMVDDEPITSSDVTTALGYTPYDSSNPNGYTSNTGTVTSVNNVAPVNGNVTLNIPSISGLADYDLSNLTSTGKKVIDGQWVPLRTLLADGVSVSNTLNKTIDLSTYLPDSNYNYEVLFSVFAITASTSGKFCSIFVKSSLIGTDSNSNGIRVVDVRTRTSSSMEAAGCVIIPVENTSQQVVITSDPSSNSSGSFAITAHAYRRIGTNT